MPDVAFIFGEKFKDYDLDDTRYFVHDLRVMLTTNKINPKIYKVTKVNELAPKGIFKCIVKQDEFDEKKDNVDLMICDYYDDDGDIVIDKPINDDPDPTKTSVIHWAEIDSNGEIAPILTPTDAHLTIGETSYFIAEFSDNKPTNIQWRVEYVNVTSADEDLPDERKEYYCNLLKISQFGNGEVDNNNLASISLRPNKMKSLIGKKFKLIVENYDGEYMSSIEVEVK